MPRARTNAGWLAALLLVIVLLLAGYMGAYYGMLEGQMGVVRHGDYRDFGFDYPSVPFYRGHNEWLEMVFTPANTIDRWIRPEYWGMTDATPLAPPPDDPDEGFSLD